MNAAYIRYLLLSLLVFGANVQAAEPQTYQQAFELNRAMYGKGHLFTWQGQEFSTDHPEELDAQTPATRDKAKAMLHAAQVLNQRASELEYAWRMTAGLLEQAEQSLQAGEFRQCMNLAAQAHYQARMSIQQAEYNQQHWRDAVPQ